MVSEIWTSFPLSFRPHITFFLPLCLHASFFYAFPHVYFPLLCSTLFPFKGGRGEASHICGCFTPFLSSYLILFFFSKWGGRRHLAFNLVLLGFGSLGSFKLEEACSVIFGLLYRESMPCLFCNTKWSFGACRTIVVLVPLITANKDSLQSVELTGGILAAGKTI